MIFAGQIFIAATESAGEVNQSELSQNIVERFRENT